MAWIIQVVDPFQPLNGVEKFRHAGGITIKEWLLEHYGEGFVEFEHPTICLVNGLPVMRSEWDKRTIACGDVVNFIRCVGYTWIVVVLIILIIALVVYTMVANGAPPTPGELPASSPVFSNNGKTNQVRLGEPIEVNYGRNRIYPSLASRPFYRYVANDQFQHSLFCIGQGEYSISDIQIGDTSIDNFEEVDYEIIPPHGTTSLFATDVITSVEVGGQQLYATNQREYVAPGWVGPFPSNPPGSTARRLEVDITFPRGLYQTDRSGRMYSVTVHISIQYRPIDDLGVPLGAFVEMLADGHITKRTTTPQRMTFAKDVTPGRYEVQMRRLDPRVAPSLGQDEIHWEGLRGFLTGDEPDYGNLTLLAVKIRATNNLNTRTAEKFNVIATRKLPIRAEDGTWSAPVATRSIIWAFVDIFKSTYGGWVLSDAFFDWDTLLSLDTHFDTRNEHFDWTFRDPITVWDAAKAVARVGRSVPMLSGSLITMRRDQSIEVPVTLFTPDNIQKGSFTWAVQLWEPNDFDSLSVEYTERNTGYAQEIVLCTLPGGTTDHPEEIRMPGVQDRAHAFREGLFMLASRKYRRENITFETGMEGYIPSYGDLIYVSHDVPRWAQHGFIVAVEEISDGRFLLAVSEPLRFEESSPYQMVLRGNKAQPLGPYNVEEQSDPKRVIIDIPDSDIDFLLGGKTEPMLFVFGVIDLKVKHGRVIKIEPQSGERIKITAVNEDPLVHTFDDIDPPALSEHPFPDDPDVPIISHLILAQVLGTDRVHANWTASTSARYYVIQWSLDGGDSWNDAGVSAIPAHEFLVTPGEVEVRVAAVGNAQGPWISGTVIVSPIRGISTLIPWDALEWKIGWWLNIDIDSYNLKVYDNTNPLLPVLKHSSNQVDDHTVNNFFDYDYADAVADGNVTRHMLFTIDGVSMNDITGLPEAYNLPASVELENEIPPAPLHADGFFTGDLDSNDDPIYALSWDPPEAGDIYKLKLWVSEVSGFDPATTTPVYEQTVTPGDPLATGYSYAHPSSSVFVDIYWRVGVFDVWGNEISINVTDEMAIVIPWILAGAAWDDGGKWVDSDFWNDS